MAKRRKTKKRAKRTRSEKIMIAAGILISISMVASSFFYAFGS